MFVLGKPIQSSLLLVGKDRSLHYSEALERCSTQEDSGLTCKQQTNLERHTRGKHSSLLKAYVNYGCKRFYILGPRCNSNNHFTAIIYKCSQIDCCCLDIAQIYGKVVKNQNRLAYCKF